MFHLKLYRRDADFFNPPLLTIELAYPLLSPPPTVIITCPTNGRNIDFCKGILTESSWQGGDSHGQAFSPSEFLGSTKGWGDSY